MSAQSELANVVGDLAIDTASALRSTALLVRALDARVTALEAAAAVPGPCGASWAEPEAAQAASEVPDAERLPDGWTADAEGIRDGLNRTRAWWQPNGTLRIGGLALTVAELAAIDAWARRTAR